MEFLLLSRKKRKTELWNVAKYKITQPVVQIPRYLARN